MGQRKLQGDMPRSPKAPATAGHELTLRTRLLVAVGGQPAFGPGKASLLEAIIECGSLAQAAKKLGMSYMRAWSLTQGMQRLFREPLLVMARGGRNKGGAALTETGRAVLDLYREMEAAAEAVVRKRSRELAALVGPRSPAVEVSPARRQSKATG
jgi:molybdate transport system regulatory protein